MPLAGFAGCLRLDCSDSESDTADVEIFKFERSSFAITDFECHYGSAIHGNSDTGDLSVKTLCGKRLSVASGVAKKDAEPYGRGQAPCNG